jgi:hypothetical protein
MPQNMLQSRIGMPQGPMSGPVGPVMPDPRVNPIGNPVQPVWGGQPPIASPVDARPMPIGPAQPAPLLNQMPQNVLAQRAGY